MFHHATVFKKGEIVGGRFDAENVAKLVVHFDGSWTHVMFDTSAFNASMEVISEIALVEWGKLFAKEGGDVISFDGVDSSTHERIVDGL